MVAATATRSDQTAVAALFAHDAVTSTAAHYRSDLTRRPVQSLKVHRVRETEHFNRLASL